MALMENMEDSEIKKLLKSEFDVGEHQIKELCNGLYAALGYHEDMGAMYHSETSIKEYRGSIQTAYDSIRKLNIALNNLSEMDRLLLDDYYREANAPDVEREEKEDNPKKIYNMLMIDLANKTMFETGQPESAFYEVSRCMEEALKLAEKNIRSPGAGGASRRGKEYIAAIEMLARCFSDIFPDCKVSAMPNTPFYKYAQFWFQCFVDPDDNDKDIRRHIMNTLNHPHVRLHHDKGRI